MPGEAVESAAPRRWSHVGALDGLRACAVLFVIGFHSGISWLGGGYYGVDVFFALSGFLITSLLVAEWDQKGTISLPGFWARRARRLLPALFVMLAAVGVGAALWPAVLGSPQLVGDTAATVGYFANWHYIYAGAGYFGQLNTGSALTHTWTLSIEEQFYLLWPLVLLVVLRRPGAARRRAPKDPDDGSAFDPAAHRRRRLRVLLLLTTTGAVASAVAMAVLAPIGNPDPVRAYFGTDTQAQCLLIGAALAALIALRRGETSTGLRRVLGGLGFVGAAGLALMCSRVPSSSPLAFHGGFALVALSSAAVIGAVFTCPRHPLTILLEWRPARYVGRISYGMYLWYLPVLMVMTPARMGTAGYALAAERLGVIAAIAATSYHFIETPIRRGALAGWWARIAAPTGAALAIVAALMAAVFAPVQATLTSVPADAVGVHTATAAPVRILLIGDSMAGSLGVGLASVAARYGAAIINEGSPACSLSMDQMVKILWYTDPPGPPCQDNDPAALIDQLRAWVRTYNPDVVVYLARSDTLNEELHGRWTNLGDPAFDAWYAHRLNEAVGVLSSEGARVVLLTSPYYDPGGQGDGDGFPENQPDRVVIDNQILTGVAHSHPMIASVINLNAMTSPHRQYTQDIAGVALRCTDGVHFTIPGGQWIGAQLLPRLVALGRDHLQTALTRGRSPVPAEAPPSWYAELPCAQ